MSQDTPNTEAGVVAALAQAAARQPHFTVTDDGRAVIFLPTEDGGWTPHDLSDPNRDPGRPPVIAQGVTLQTLDSLVDYANRFKTADTLLFADIDASAIHAALDYHRADPKGEAHKAELLRHSARMKLPHSVEWQTWTAIDGKLFGQLEFARFIEENAGDIVAPSGADLLEVCRDIQAVRKVNFIKAVRTSSDNESFEWVDDTQASSRKGNVEIPTQFKLELPVYFGEGAVSLYAFLRWRLVDGEGLKLGVQLHRAEHVRQAVFKDIVTRAADRIGAPAMFGRLGS